MGAFSNFFIELADKYPSWNFIFFYDKVSAGKILIGLYYTFQLSVFCIFFSLVIGVVGAWIQKSPLRWLRLVNQAYIQFFRNTPPFVQLLFFYFALGQFTPTFIGSHGEEIPIISNIGWAIISLSFFAGSYNVEIFRAGVESVPESTIEAARALGFSRLQTYVYVVLPLAFRVSLSSLNNNLVNLVKTTTHAYVIAVPELLYQLASMWADYPSAQNPAMLLLMISYVSLVWLLIYGMAKWEKKMRIPGM